MALISCLSLPQWTGQGLNWTNKIKININEFIPLLPIIMDCSFPALAQKRCLMWKAIKLTALVIIFWNMWKWKKKQPTNICGRLLIFVLWRNPNSLCFNLRLVTASFLIQTVKLWFTQQHMKYISLWFLNFTTARILVKKNISSSLRRKCSLLKLKRFNILLGWSLWKKCIFLWRFERSELFTLSFKVFLSLGREWGEGEVSSLAFQIQLSYPFRNAII